MTFTHADGTLIVLSALFKVHWKGQPVNPVSVQNSLLDGKTNVRRAVCYRWFISMTKMRAIIVWILYRPGVLPYLILS